MIKIYGLSLFLSFCAFPFYFSTPAMANTQCAAHLGLASVVRLRPMNAVIVEVFRKQYVMAFGPYIGGDHVSILYNLQSGGRNQIERVVWAGEVLVTKENNTVVIHESNEMSPSLASYRLNSSGLPQADLIPALSNLTFERSDFRYIRRFAKEGTIKLADSYRHQSRSLGGSRIVNTTFDTSVYSMIAFRNRVSRLVMSLNTMINRGNFMGSDEDFLQTLKDIQAYLPVFLELSDEISAESSQVLQRYMVFVEMILASNKKISELPSGQIKDLYSGILFVSNNVLKDSNKPVSKEVKIRK